MTPEVRACLPSARWPEWRVKMSNRAPAYRDHVSHFDALRLVALRGGDRIGATLTTENERKCLGTA